MGNLGKLKSVNSFMFLALGLILFIVLSNQLTIVHVSAQEPDGTHNYVFTSEDIDKNGVIKRDRLFYLGEISDTWDNISFTDNCGLRIIHTHDFDGLYFKTVFFPCTLESVERDAFGNMNSLTKVTFSGDIESIGMIAFENCINLTEVNFYGNLPVIERDAFKNTGVENLGWLLYF